MRHIPLFLVGVGLAASCVLVGCCTPPQRGSSTAAPATAAPKADLSWAKLCGDLEGSWQAEIDGHTIEVDYRRTARGSALLETWMPGTPAETISVYHLDGDSIVVTHYCGQGNQPRLRSSGSSNGAVTFTQFDVTDLNADEASLDRLVLTIEDGVLERRESYVQEGQAHPSTLMFRRVPDAAARE